MDFNTIYVVNRSVSYGDMGDDHDLSFHKTMEGAFLQLDSIAIEYGLTKENIVETPYDGQYFYHRDNETLSVNTITLKD